MSCFLAKSRIPALGPGFLLKRGSECKPRSKLELARGIDVGCDQPEVKALLLHADNAVHAWVSVLRKVSHVVAGEIEAQRFRFPKVKRLVNGEVQIARSPGANVVRDRPVRFPECRDWPYRRSPCRAGRNN